MNKYFLAAAALCCMTITVFTSCSENDDDIAVDVGVWPVPDNATDTSYRPGDDFFMYSNGGFWKTATVDESKIDINCWAKIEVPQLMEQRMNSVHFPSMEKMKKDLDGMNDAQIALQKEQMQQVFDRINVVNTREEAWTLTGKLIKEGYNLPFMITSFSVKGTMSVVVQFDNSNYFTKKSLLAPEKKSLHWQLANNPKALASVKPLISGNTRSFDQAKFPILAAIMEAAGFPLEYVYTIDSFYEAPENIIQSQLGILQGMQNADVEEYKQFLINYICADEILYDDDRLAKLNANNSQVLTREEMIDNFSSRYLKYEKSKALTDAYITQEMKDRTRKICEELRHVFLERIASNTWMGEVTRNNIREKLEAMTFNIGAPDEYITEGLPDISQAETLFDDVRGLRSADINLMVKVTGRPTPEVSFQMLTAKKGLETVNAFYEPNTNSMNIFPAWMLEPYYDARNNEAFNYATALTFGHEITHGFDPNGLKYDKLGDLGNLWGSDADKQEYNRRAQQLIDCYSGFEVMPWAIPGLYNDGAYTIGENVADLGGLILSYEAYKKHLTEKGFTGEQFDLQCKRFYQSVAWLWHGKYSVKYAQYRTAGEGEYSKEKDYHSLFRERVNGTVSNTDDWYKLFNVTSTDKLFRKAEDRIRIW